MNGLGRFADSRWLGWLAAFGLFLLSRPFPGVHHDGRLYVGDAMAKLDPGGVGRDLIFVHDGQFGFSLYTPLLARLIAVLGVSGATLAIVVVTLLLWFAALALLIERLLADRPPGERWAALVFAAILPPLYGAMNVIGFGEPYATPRGLAEAAGLLGMASYLSGRRILALSACALGMLFHPIMGLCAAAAIGLAIGLEDRRWLWAGLVALGVAVIAGVLRLPLADRIVTVMDPAWRAIVETRSPILFPSLWSAETWGRLTVQACTLAAAASLLTGAPRRLALGALAAGLAGVAASALLADHLSLLLFLQAQTWRTLQPLAVLATIGLALVCVEAPKKGAMGLIGLAFLGMAWMVRGIGDLGLLAAPVGLAFLLLGDRARLSRPRLYGAVAVGVLAAALVGYGALRSYALRETLARLPEVWPFSQGLVWASDLPALLIAGAVGLWMARSWPAPSRSLRLGGLLLVGLLAALLWDDRSAYIRQRDIGRDPALVSLISARPGEVLWLAGDVEPWIVAGRPSWISKVQSAGVVFSRPLAMALHDRVARVEAAGLAGRDWIRPLMMDALKPPTPRLEKVLAFCAASDAPAWIVSPLWDGEGALDPRLGARTWSPKAAYAEDLTDAAGRRWMTARRYAVIPCRGA
ncbi:hypothetical protein CA606_02365 [Caulobacter vibrioides]|uniref:Uncharacterized protein n=1 Tax=Caulobacter vibrioides TaxID=155892 RepID=A0A290MN90_CAUVI|nr:hypothetical protein [Caulobacter vibrioides]ATC31279.1 hypothetical protein CA606_02365 [Caulobacter vibrioides]